ncbi:rhomboid family intramembrane serine protease [Rubritalea spongiae]|uniref:Rhomboid family intramembrane serine protease n=1 Tax=Rubritalea spongiae TaxID=430797 RepID=A0ABW5E2H4_9BACT
MSRFAGAPATKWLLILNIAIFFIDVAGVGRESWGRLTPMLAFTMEDTFGRLQLWRLVSFQFLHGGLGHLMFNMFAIYMFGGIVERVLGTRRYLAYYLLCGVAGALFYALLAWVGWLGSGVLVGASAGIFGIIVALIVIAPDMQVMLLIPPIPMKMKTLGMVMLGIGVYTVLTTGNNAGGEAGHLGGAFLGFVLMKFPRLLDWTEFIGKSQIVVKAKTPRMNYQAKVRPRTELNLDTTEIDRILDKVSTEGLHSLTDEERETLHRVSNRD